jgi:phosphoinositide-3-kinase regulatory subunit 4
MSYDASLTDLQTQIQDLVEVLLVDPSLSVKRALLANITSLCVFLGRSRTGDVFSLMTTHLNDREWSLRSAFFEATTGISTCIGSKNVDEYILPLMADRLAGKACLPKHRAKPFLSFLSADNEENVIARELSSLSTLAELGLYQKHRMWELLSVVIALLAHPNVWIRSGAASFIAAAAKTLNSTDVWCGLYPALRKMLRSDIANIDELSILTASVGPVRTVRLVSECWMLINIPFSWVDWYTRRPWLGHRDLPKARFGSPAKPKTWFLWPRL